MNVAAEIERQIGFVTLLNTRAHSLVEGVDTLSIAVPRKRIVVTLRSDDLYDVRAYATSARAAKYELGERIAITARELQSAFKSLAGATL